MKVVKITLKQAKQSDDKHQETRDAKSISHKIILPIHKENKPHKIIHIASAVI